jgi:integrase
MMKHRFSSEKVAQGLHKMSDKKSLNYQRAAKGIAYREHPSRKHGKRADRYYVLIFKLGGKTIREAVGWSSDGVTQDACEKLLVQLRDNWRNGTGPQTYAEMKAAAAKQKAEQEAREIVEQSRLITVADYFEQHFLPYAKRTKKPQSWEKEVSHFTHWINPSLGHLPVVEIGFPQWEILLKRLDKAQLAQRTKEYISGTLRRILRHAAERGLDVKVPTGKQVGVTAPKDNRRLRVLTPKESEDILSALEKRNIHAWRMVKFAMLTGCRASEAFNLRWRDVDIEEKQLRFVDTKNNDTRIIFLSPALIELLVSFGPGSPGEIVFPRSDGSPHTEAPQSLRTVIDALGLNEGRAHRDRVTFHTIRHTVATQLAKSLDVRSLMDIMGWKVVAMAARYIHSNEDTKRAAMAALEKTLAPSDKVKIIPFTRMGGA